MASQHKICDCSGEPHPGSIDLNDEDWINPAASEQNKKAYSPSKSNKYVYMELLQLKCAFSCLKKQNLELYQHVELIIAEELDARLDDPSDWVELLTGGWDFTLWTFWIYIVLVLHLREANHDLAQSDVSRWIGEMLK